MVNATYVKEVEELEAKDRGNTTGNDVLDEEDFCEGENKSKTHKDVSEMKAAYKLSSG